MANQEISLGSDKSSSINSEIITVKKGGKYVISTKYIGRRGSPFCAYFGVVFLNEEKNEIDRKIRWFNDFSGQLKDTSIVFKSPNNSIMFIYRINAETDIKSQCSFSLLPIQQIVVSEIESKKHLQDLQSKISKVVKKFEESYDSLQDYVFPKAKELNSEEEEKLEKNLVWIFASPRSGTTWLGTQLLAEKTLVMDEPRIGRFIFPDMLDVDDHRKDFLFCNDFKKTSLFFLRKLILNRIYSQYRNLNKKIIIKEPNSSLAAQVISECLPRSKMIILLRDGRDVIDSLMNARSKNGWITKSDDHPPINKKDRLNFLRKECIEWVKITQIILEAFYSHSKDSRYIIKYEDLRKNTLEELKKIFLFLELNVNDKELKKIVSKYHFENISINDKGSGKKIRSATPGMWKENFSKNEQILIKEIMGKRLEEISYEN